MNIADRSEAARRGHETRRRREALALMLEARKRGARKLRVWHSWAKRNTPVKPWQGPPPMGHDSPPSVWITRGPRDPSALPVPADYLTVEVNLRFFNLDSPSGRRLVAKFGRTVCQTDDDAKLVKVRQFQTWLGSI